MKIIAVSGGFDPLHIGHINLFKSAKQLGDKLVVILNSDEWLKAKKGYAFMPQEERKAVLEAVKYVDEVIITHHAEKHEDVSVCRELRKIKPNIFANGGDRNQNNIPEYDLCEKLGIKMAFNVGGGKIRSSSDLVKKQKEHLKTN